MNINMSKRILMSVLMLLIVIGLPAQEKIKIEGVVYNAMSKKPMPDVQVSSLQASKSAMTDENGAFSIEVTSARAVLLVRSFGFLDQEIIPGKRTRVKVFLLPENSYLEGGTYHSLGEEYSTVKRQGTAVSLRQRDMNTGYNSPEESLYGKIAGLNVISKGGMPGEGAALYMRGIRSVMGENTPLIVIDGMPYNPALDASPTISGFSKNIFMPVNLKEVGEITFLKGADAAMYGSLGSNGVVVIETESANDMETKLQFHTNEGISFISKRIPLLNARQNKAYLADIGENKYADPNELVSRLPFLEDNPDNPANYLYNHDTDWQKEIYTPAFTSENVLKVKGGDAVAKYMLTVGTQQNSGAIKNTHLSKYFTRLNANINFSQRLTAQMGASLNYSDYKLQEQGMAPKTNPFLASLYQAPFMSVYKQAYQMDGTVKDVPFFNPVHEELQLSNPAAIVSDLQATSRTYDIIVNIGFNYKVSSLFNINAMFGLYYDHTKDDIFIPGKNYHAIAPLQDSLAINSVRASVQEQKNYYGRVNGIYKKKLNEWHSIGAMGGMQMMTSKKELDFGEGANTPTDFYTTLEKVTFAKNTDGYLDKWSWMNFFLQANYSYRDQFLVTAGVTLDGAASYGKNSGRWFAFPSVKGAWRMKESNWLNGVDWLSALTVRGEFGINGNSRFESRLGKYYYESVNYQWTSGIYRNGLPNSKLSPEKVYNSSIGLDFAVVGNRLNLGVDLYRENTRDMIIRDEQAAILGFPYRYKNSGEIDTKGIEATFKLNLVNTKDWNWLVGGNIAHFKSEVKSLGNVDKKEVTFTDGANLLMQVGESPYLFYGNKAEKIFTTSAEANAANYRAQNGTYFVAGDVKFLDKNNDKYINNEDFVVIGDPTPDFYGGFYSNLTYKNWGLFMNFTYSYGNDIYNGVRRSLESMTDFSNQDHAIARRWQIEGQQTDIPRASYGDPSGNSRFSSRWIEDGSYLKLKEVTLSYETNKKKWIFNSIRVYLTGENLVTFTKYLGMDPEFSYSYDPQMLGLDLGKMPLSRNVKLGVILNF